MTTTTDEIKPNTAEKGVALFEELRTLLTPFPASSYIHLLPTAAQDVSDLYRPTVTVVKVDGEDKRDVYPTPGGGGTVCLHSQALERIANAAGIDFDPTLGRHVHDRQATPFVCEIHVGGWYTDSLGQRRPITAGAVSDLRDGTVTAKVLMGANNSQKSLDVARQFICERTESRARNRAIRKTTNLPSSFTKDELTKPMVAVRFRLDERDPDVRRALIDQGTRASTQVFAITGPALDAGVARPDEEIIEGQVTERAASSSSGSDEHSGPSGEDAGSTPAPRSVQVDPDPVEEKPPVDQERAQTIRAHVESVRAGLKWGKDAREKRPTAPQAGASVSAIAAAVTTSKGQLNVEQKKAVWRAVTEFVFGPFGSYEELNSDQVSTLIDFSKEFPGEVQELVAFLAQSNERVAEIAAALSGQQQLGVAS